MAGLLECGTPSLKDLLCEEALVNVGLSLADLEDNSLFCFADCNAVVFLARINWSSFVL